MSDEQPKDQGLVQFVDLAEIRIGLNNPRKHFKTEAIEELRESIRTKGILQPLLVRPLQPEGNDFSGAKYELVAGECRLRCATELQLPQVPCLIRELTASEALEMQLIENLSRSSLDPIEEANGFAKLMELGEMTAKELAARLNKQVAYIYFRLKLLFLPKEGREALLDGRLTFTAARQIGSLPHEEWRKEAVKIVLEPTSCKNPDVQRAFHLYSRDEGVPLTTRETAQLLPMLYMRSLQGAPFDQADPTLNPAMGACTTCPARAGNSPDLFPDLRADMCTDLKCFEKKKLATRAKIAAEAEASGKKVMPAKEVESQLVQYYGNTKYQLKHGSKYVALNAQVDEDEVAENVKSRPSWKHLLKSSPDVPVVVAIDPDGVAHELVDHAVAVEAVKKVKPELFAKRERSVGSAQDDKELAKYRREREINREVTSLAIDAVRQKIEKGEKPGEVFAKAMLNAVMRDIEENEYSDPDDPGVVGDVLARRGYEFTGDSHKALEVYRKSLSPGGLLALAIDLMLSWLHADANGDEMLVAFMAAYKIDRKKLEVTAKQVVALREEARKLKEGETLLAKELPKLLKTAGKEGLPAKVIAAELKLKLNAVLSWFAANGKSFEPALASLGDNKYALAEFWPKEETEAQKKPIGKQPLGRRIAAELTSAGVAGCTVKDLAAKLKVKPSQVSSWFYTSGKKHKPTIYKIGEAKYAITRATVPAKEEAVAA